MRREKHYCAWKKWIVAAADSWLSLPLSLYMYISLSLYYVHKFIEGSLKCFFDKITENNLPKIRELSDFNEIFSAYSSMNDLYNAVVFLGFLIIV